MWKYGSERRLAWAYGLALSLLTLSAGLFYIVQNSGLLSGGAIALPKLIWLALAVFFWYCLPALIASDTRVSARIRGAYAIFLASMIVRAVIELWMMYVSHNWHPYYGIAHDVFSLGLIGYLQGRVKASSELDRLLKANLLILGLMLAVEIVFVWYMLSHVEESGGATYFVPPAGGHFAILMTTWVVVGMLTSYLVMFSRRWLGGHAQRGS